MDPGPTDLGVVDPQQQQQRQRRPPSRYESQKRRDWNTFLQYLRSHRPPLSLARCSGAHVIEFLKYLDQQAWGSLDALVGRLRAAYEENDGLPESNPFGARAVGIYLREVKESQGRARGVPYQKKKTKKKKRKLLQDTAVGASIADDAAGASIGSSEAGEGSRAPPAGSSPAS
ncbi:hypothetical protein MUK42_26345 [Musa troglodytarum]|uniref:ALOG domain-containing protein n=1 Tax=Musa troglodytarum TaxID=320322 RepID=A0A9E7HSP4_9LILI|nr:hypothetical protein MUK42_26345 [Musa troglodytarum]